MREQVIERICECAQCAISKSLDAQIGGSAISRSGNSAHRRIGEWANRSLRES